METFITDRKEELKEKLQALLKNSTRANPMAWSDILKKFGAEYSKPNGQNTTKVQEMYSVDEIVQAMNEIIMPFGTIKGEDHYFWTDSGAGVTPNVNKMLETSQMMFDRK